MSNEDNTRDLADIIDSGSSSSTSYIIDDLDIDSDSLDIQTKKKGLENFRYHQNTLDRKWLAEWTAIIVSVWLLAVLAILVNNYKYLHLSDTILSVLLGTTTLNVLGLSLIVLRGHFDMQEKEK